ncbi:hypothetical protein JAAARDRAFT_202389 [Jaapia argillacea MUCL 33604]|uniref:Uncharacterized protein n=1 Tax=Jaapia argillacea MUCL 33604 TaxID=933084 RepID=A0A067QDN2_9AGAM|nr:hypothetical protein JAAARDRAFT_202389 [Jaapia argillacea MUCL 33604]
MDPNSIDQIELRANTAAGPVVSDVEPRAAEKKVTESNFIWAPQRLKHKPVLPVDLCTSLPASTIRLIPYEILAMIFKHCVDADQLVPHTEPIALSLAGVCRLWREIMLAHLPLWSSIRFEPDQQTIWSSFGQPRKRISWFQSAADLFLRLSGQSPLQVSMGWKPLQPAAVVKLLSRNAHRLQHVEVEQRFPVISPLLRAMADDSPLLESLTISLHRSKARVYVRLGHPPPPHLDHDIEQFRTPQLRRLTILATFLPFFLPFPWSQLTHLRIGDYSRDRTGAKFPLWRCYDALHHCSSVTHLWLDMADDCRNNPPSRAPLSLPNLKFILLRNTPSDSIFFESLVAPCLKVLEYGTHYCGIEYSFPSVESFGRCLSRSPCLTALSLQASYPIFADILAFLRCLPGLTDFVWIIIRATILAVRGISCPPSLIGKLCEGPLIRMITSRCPPSTHDGHPPFPQSLRLVRIHADEDQGRRIASHLNLATLGSLEFDVYPPEQFPRSFTWLDKDL